MSSQTNARAIFTLRTADAGGISATTVNDAFPEDTSTRLVAAWEALAGSGAFYVDGTSVTIPADDEPAPSNITDLNIGAQWGETFHLNGHIAEIRYYSTRLTDQQLEDMSNGIFPVELRHKNAALGHNSTDLRHKDTTIQHNDTTLGLQGG